MRTLSRITIVALAAVLVLALGQPAEASCGNPSLIGTRTAAGASFIWTAGVFTPNYVAGYPPGMYSADAGPPVTTNFAGVYWGAGNGDTTAGLGTDSGSYDWANAGGFYYAAYPPYGPYFGYYSAGSIFSSWFPPGVDGCLGINACMCLLMTDQDGMNGYFALTGAMSNSNGDTFLDQGGADPAGNQSPIILVPIPAPRITGSARADCVDLGGNPVDCASAVALSSADVDISVTVDPTSGGVYVKDGCNCGPTGFRVRQQVLGRGDGPPSDRGAGWDVATMSDGLPQPDGGTPLGGTVSVRASCGASDADTYLATELVFDSGFGTNIVSTNSTRVECGPNLAEPDDGPGQRPGHAGPRPRGDRPNPPRRR